MFDLDRLAAFDRGLASLPHTAPHVPRGLDGQRRRVGAPDHVRSGGEAVARCTMVASLGVEPLCPFARMEAVA